MKQSLERKPSKQQSKIFMQVHQCSKDALRVALREN